MVLEEPRRKLRRHFQPAHLGSWLKPLWSRGAGLSLPRAILTPEVFATLPGYNYPCCLGLEAKPCTGKAPRLIHPPLERPRVSHSSVAKPLTIPGPGFGSATEAVYFSPCSPVVLSGPQNWRPARQYGMSIAISTTINRQQCRQVRWAAMGSSDHGGEVRCWLAGCNSRGRAPCPL